MAIKSGFRLIFGLIILVLGFMAGVAWKSSDKVETDTTEVSTTTSSENSEAINNQTNTGELNEAELATINLFEKAAPSVCFITTSNVRRDFFTRDISEIPRGTGSGFIWDNKGHIVTNIT